MRERRAALLVAGLICWFVSAPPPSASSADAPPANAIAQRHPQLAAATPDFNKAVRPLLQRYCFECHGDGNMAGDLDLDEFKTSADVTSAQGTWLKVVRFARSRVMPPPEAERQPTQDEREALVAALQRQLYDPRHPDPGRATPRRLNRAEYRNTVRDLTGVAFDPTLDFPEDDTGYGFDNIADVLTLPPLLMEKYLAAAEKILDEAIPTEQPESRERHYPSALARASFNAVERRNAVDSAGAVPEGFIALSSTEEDFLSVRLEIPTLADYTLRVLAYARPIATTQPATAPARPMTMSLMLGDVVVKDVEVTADAAHPQWYEARTSALPARQSFRAAVRRRRGVAEDAIVRNGRVGEEQAGQVLVKEMIIEGPLPGMVQRFSGEQLAVGGRASRNGGEVVRLPTTGDEAIATVDVPTDADYLLRVQACAEIAGAEPAKMQVRLDNRALEVFDVTAPAAYRPAPADKDLTDRARRALPRVYEIRTRLNAGKHRISAAFINNLRLPDDPRPNFRDRNLLVHHIELVELSGDPRTLPISPPLRALFAKHEQTRAPTTMPAVDARAARAILGDFALRAWRRPAQTEELNRLMKLYDLALANGESFRGSVKHAMNAVLVSPSFLFRGVISPQFAGRTPPAPQLVDDFELASRLSYFLWSTTPDDELLSLARRSELRPKLDAQLKRMLASPKANAFVDNFAGQWLQFRNLDAAHPDSKKFDTYNDRLRDAMKRETQMFFQSIVQDDRSLLDMLTADYTFLNERLAKHYGVAGVSGEEFRRVSLAGTQRRGVLTQGSVLTLTSNPTRTSPVKRGKWVLENVLGTPPPPPPPNIPPLESDDGKPLVGTLRQRLEQHRADVTCASCHAPMDPIGFALENFDAIGRWRVTDGEGKIDAASVLPDGTKLNGPAELATLLAKTRRNDFYRSVIEAALTFALGRGVEPFDQPAVDRIVDDLRKNDGRFSSLIAGVVHSVPFQMRRGEAGETAEQTTRAEARR